MCVDPISLVGSAVSTATALTGSLLGASNARSQARSAEASARAAAQQAEVAEEQGLANAQQEYRKGAQQRGTLRAQMAANGIDPASGSALAQQADLGAFIGQAAGNERDKAHQAAINARNQAARLTNLAHAARRNAQRSLLGGGQRAASGLTSFSADRWGDLWSSQEDEAL